METSRLLWYLEHRIAYIRNRQSMLRDVLDQSASDDFDYDKLKDFMENKGRLMELQHIVKRVQQLSEV